jgi:acyl carrier protein
MPTPKSLSEMKTMLIARVSSSLRIKGEMDPDAPFQRYGLQSIDAVILAMEIEEEIGFEMPPTLLWEYDTINKCSEHLFKLAAEEKAA